VGSRPQLSNSVGDSQRQEANFSGAIAGQGAEPATLVWSIRRRGRVGAGAARNGDGPVVASGRPATGAEGGVGQRASMSKRLSSASGWRRFLRKTTWEPSGHGARSRAWVISAKPGPVAPLAIGLYGLAPGAPLKASNGIAHGVVNGEAEALIGGGVGPGPSLLHDAGQRLARRDLGTIPDPLRRSVPKREGGCRLVIGPASH
jgi:hypothetical protein